MVTQFDGGMITSDAGGLLLREANEAFGVIGQFAACFRDHRDPELIEQQPKGSFAAFVRGNTTAAIPLTFPLGYLESKPKMSHKAWSVVRDRMRSRYAAHLSELERVTEKANDDAMSDEKQPETEAATSKKPTTTPGEIDTKPGSEW